MSGEKPRAALCGPIEPVLLKMPALRAYLGGWSHSAVYDAVKRGEFPAPIRLGAKAVAWRRCDVDAWLASRPTTRDAA